MFNDFFSLKSFFYDNVEKYYRGGQERDDMHAHAHYMPDTSTHSGYIIHTAFPLQQWLHKRSSVLRHT